MDSLGALTDSRVLKCCGGDNTRATSRSSIPSCRTHDQGQERIQFSPIEAGCSMNQHQFILMQGVWDSACSQAIRAPKLNAKGYTLRD